MTQDPLPFSALVARQGASLVSDLEDALQGRGWMTAKALAQILQTDDRTIREAASQSEGRVISGQRGYHLTSEATVTDVQHAADWLKSQAKQMWLRAIDIERQMHRRNNPAA